jgi:hypothetical protein
MRAFLYWLQVGIASLVALQAPVPSFSGRELAVRVEAKALFTDRMIDLLDHGLAIRLKLEASIKIEMGQAGQGESGQRRLFASASRSLRKDHLSGQYILEEESPSGIKLERSFGGIGELERAAKAFDLRFTLPEGWRRASFFAKLRLVDDEVLAGKLGISASSLWSGYEPSVFAEWKEGG